MKIPFRLPPLTIVVSSALIGATIVSVGLLYWLFGWSSIVINNSITIPVHPSTLSGIACDNATRRPIAVMLASDVEARPLSAIGQADMVFEMPVTPNGLTRMMAVFQCNQPKEIGSIRSARASFIALAQGLDAILVHWGGEKDALDALNSGVINNVNALLYDGTTFYRKRGVPSPHDGFTSSDLLTARINQLEYRATTSMEPYAHLAERKDRNLGSLADTITVSWPQKMNVRFTYDATNNTYLRSRGGTPEYDALTNTQVRASVVVVMQTDATFLHDQYIHVRTIGTGNATIWQGGQRINGLWKKDRATDTLTFTDANGGRILFEPGMIWVLIDAPLPTP